MQCSLDLREDQYLGDLVKHHLPPSHDLSIRLMMHLSVDIDDASETVRFTATAAVPPTARLEVFVDGVSLATIGPGDSGPSVQRLSFEALRTITVGQLELLENGASIPTGVIATDGDFFEALTLPDPESFHVKLQLNHSRYQSRLLLELGARCAYERFKDDPLTRAAALTILGHRYIERLMPQRTPAEEARIRWLLDHACPLVSRATALLAIENAAVYTPKLISTGRKCAGASRLPPLEVI